MRPKKIILCIDADADARSLRVFVLRIAGYAVLEASDQAEAIKMFSDFPVDLVLMDLPAPARDAKDAFTTIGRLKQIARHIPVIALGTAAQMERIHGADALLVRATLGSAELIERIKIMSARKRGPRKGSARSPRPVPLTRVLEAAHA